MAQIPLNVYVERRANAGAVAFRVRVGKGHQLQTAGVVVLGDAGEQWEASATEKDDYSFELAEDTMAAVSMINEVAEGSGWPEDYPTCRVHSYCIEDKDGKLRRTQGPSWQSTKRTASEGGAKEWGGGAPSELAFVAKVQAEQNASLTSSLIRMAGQMGGVVETLGETLQQREAMGRELAADLIDQQRETVKAEASAAEIVLQNLADDLEDQSAQAEGGDPNTERALGIVEGIMERFMGGGADLGDILADDDAVDSIMGDPRAQEAFVRAQQRAAAKAQEPPDEAA